VVLRLLGREIQNTNHILIATEIHNQTQTIYELIYGNAWERDLNKDTACASDCFVGFLVYTFESLKKKKHKYFQPATSNIDSYFGGAYMCNHVITEYGTD
jgi:hypothetical protein